MTPAAIAPAERQHLSAQRRHRNTERRHWSIATAVAVGAHIVVAGLVLAWARTPQPAIPEPVVLVELPPMAAPAPALAATTPESAVQPQPQAVPQPSVIPPIDLPPVRAPLPSNPVTLPPPPPPHPVAQNAAAAPAPLATAPNGTGTGASAAPGNDPRARRAQDDYSSLISSYLNRRKSYPVDAKKARQEGVVTVRFTVDRNGNVSNTSIRRSSGHELLDNATLLLLQRVAPLPRMPAAMQRDSITVSLPIDYSLRTS